MVTRNNSTAVLPFLLLQIIIIIFSSSSTATSSQNFNPKAYMESMCRTTLYKNLCVRSMSRYIHSIQNRDDLARFALKVSLYRAKYTVTFLLKEATNLEKVKGKDYVMVHECLTQMRDSVNQLSQAIAEMDRKSKQDDLNWRVHNLQTWTSTAMTDAETCVRQFEGRRMSKLKASIKGKAKNVEETTSNALAFIHHYAAATAARHRIRGA